MSEHAPSKTPQQLIEEQRRETSLRIAESAKSLADSIVKEGQRPKMFVAVDFDGTCVAHRYPAVGQDVPFAVDVLKALVKRGQYLILWTMRSGKSLEEAEQWFAQRGIALFAVNSNPDQTEWTSSPKAYAHVYVDDSAFGAPLVALPGEPRAVFNWVAFASFAQERGVLDPEDLPTQLRLPPKSGVIIPRSNGFNPKKGGRR